MVKPGKTDEISKFPRLNWNAAYPTLRASTTKDRGGYQSARPIHPSEDRVITTREAARLLLLQQAEYDSATINENVPVKQ
jgi:DNA (cytosine-5)-methyltransferase 1